tara:strand:+ start:627 stop:824 length:198 start_codon:yes stop_codon:yes gene_type:complete
MTACYQLFFFLNQTIDSYQHGWHQSCDVVAAVAINANKQDLIEHRCPSTSGSQDSAHQHSALPQR